VNACPDWVREEISQEREQHQQLHKKYDVLVKLHVIQLSE
jgi:hypothetical protein